MDRLEVRHLIYRELGTTYNEIELFIMNRFPDEMDDGYVCEWVHRMMKPTAYCYMDKESMNIWLAVINKNVPIDDGWKDIKIKGDYQ